MYLKSSIVRACLSLLVLGMWVVAPAAVAQDPYGATTTTAPGSAIPAGPACQIDQASGSEGATVTGSLTGMEGGAQVRIVLGGEPATDVTVDAGATTTPFAFRVPAVEPGSHAVVAVGPTYNVPCTNPSGDRFEVLAASQGSGPGDGRLPFTGASLLAVVLAGLLALVVGTLLRRRARARRRRLAL